MSQLAFARPAAFVTIAAVITWGLITPAPAADNTGSESRSRRVSELVDRVKESVVVVSFTGRDGERLGLGSGFVVDAEGLIATNLHVLGEARPISVRTVDGQEYPVVSVHATDRTRDLAVLKIEASDLPTLALGDSAAVEQGEPIVAIGNPLGLTHSVVEGIVSAVREDVEGQPMIQLAIPIERGNSGGPVIDHDGRVLGIITLKSQLTENLGYAVGINAIKPLLSDPNPIPMDRWLTIGRLNPRLWETPGDVRWRQRAGRIHVEGRGTGFGGRSLIFSKQPLPEVPFEVAVTVRMEEEDGAAGLIFHADGGDRHYGFYPSSGQLRFSRFDGPDVFSWKVLAEERSTHYRPSEWNRLKVRIEDDLIRCYCNDALVFESRDATYTQGRVGLAKFRHTTASFKGFEIGQEVRSPLPPSPTRERLESLVADLATERPAGPSLIEEILAEAESESAVTVLEQHARHLEQQARRVRELADSVHGESVTRRLRQLFSDPAGEPDLVHAALLVASLDNIELEVAAYRRQIEQMAEELQQLFPENADEQTRRQSLGEYLFTQQGFHGSRTNYGSASNSYLNEVIDDREGLPITLSILYLALAERIGLEAEGIGLPGHFVVQVREKDEWQLVDVFDRGTLLSRDAAAQKVRSITGLSWQDSFLAPQPPRAIIVRMLRNLINSANQAEDMEAALRYSNALLALEPDSAVDRLFRAVLCYNSLRDEQALEDIDWILEQEPESIPLFRVHQLRDLIENRRSD